MKYKKSFYNLEIKKLDNDNIIMFNSFTGAFGVMNNDAQKIYDNIANINEDTLANSNQKQIFDIMKDNGFIVEEDLDEYKKLKVLEYWNRYGEKGSLTITIAPTLNCNMQCPYCYENKNNTRMNDQVKTALIEFFKKRINSGVIKHVLVTWYGGEPLLEKDTIRELSKSFIDICKEKDVEYTADIVTNGTLFDYDTAKLFSEEYKVKSAQITLDGIGAFNNKTRKLKNGADSFSIITNNIEQIKDLMRISIRINLSKENINQAPEMIDYFENIRQWKGKVYVYFAPVIAYPASNKCVSDHCFSLDEFSKIHLDLNKSLVAKGFNASIPYPRNMVMSCGGQRLTNYLVGPDGSLYKCWHEVGKKESSIGNVASGEKFNAYYVNWMSLDKPDKCIQCKLLPICHSGCPNERYYNGNKPICDYRNTTFKEKLEFVYEKYKSQNNK